MTKKIGLKNFCRLAVHFEKLHEQAVYQCVGKPPTELPKWKTHQEGLNIRYILSLVILDGHTMKKNGLRSLIFYLDGVETCMSKLCTSPPGSPHPPQIGEKRSQEMSQRAAGEKGNT